MVADHQTMRLCELHRYEAGRRAPLAEEVYRANARLIMADDANCYRFELLRHTAAAPAATAGTPAPEVKPEQQQQQQNGAAAAGVKAEEGGGAAPLPEPEQAGAAPVKQEQGPAAEQPAAAAAAAPANGKAATVAVALSVQLMDPDRVEHHPGGLDPAFGDYMGAFMGAPAPAGPAAGREGRVLLPRLARRAGGGGGDAALAAALGGVAVANGLECKISCSSSKVSYVLDTEDVMWRHRARAAGGGGGGGLEQRAGRYAAWLAGREAAIGGLEPYAQAFPEPMAQG
ncbi:hypothetical protein MNEG_15230, partial [Monoraphidium neglectum]